MIRHVSYYLERLLGSVCVTQLFPKPPTLQFRSSLTHCPDCGAELKVQKTKTRTVSTLHVGRFYAREVVLICKQCAHTYRCNQLHELVPPGGNFGYDVMVYAGEALFLRYRNEEEVVAELAQRNVLISPRGVSLLGMKFITYLAIAHQQRTPNITADMKTRGGYICHLDATCEGGNPLLMSSIDSLSEIVLGNVKLPSEDSAYIEPFLRRIKDNFGIPLALVHDMGGGILKAVKKVFPNVPDFICHFHFLRDIGKDYMHDDYDILRKRLRKHGLSAKLRNLAKKFKAQTLHHTGLIEALESGIINGTLACKSFEFIALINVYTLIEWTLFGKSEGHGYGFPFDLQHMSFAKRISRLNTELEKIKDIHLRDGSKNWRDNSPYHKLYHLLEPTINDKTLWRAVERLERKKGVFEKLRSAMRIAPHTGQHGLNDEGAKCSMRTIESHVKKFCFKLRRSKSYQDDVATQKMIAQIEKYSEKLFADPISVPTPAGSILIQPQRTNNILEQFFRTIKRSHRRRTGNASSRRMLRAILAETPLVQNLQNPAYMKILLNGKNSIEEVFAEIDIDTFRQSFRLAQDLPLKIPAKLKPLITMSDFPDKLVRMIERAVA